MHMKFMLLFAKTGGLRVVISSANLVPHDWRDVENVRVVSFLSFIGRGCLSSLFSNLYIIVDQQPDADLFTF
jgi:hypothetical protein